MSKDAAIDVGKHRKRGSVVFGEAIAAALAIGFLFVIYIFTFCVLAAVHLLLLGPFRW